MILESFAIGIHVILNKYFKKLKSLKERQTPVTLLKTPSFDDEALNIADEIEKLIKKGISPNPISPQAKKIANYHHP